MDMGYQAVGPLLLAAMEITESEERSENERLRRRYVESLLHRTDRISA
jgi:hypothetical protein